MEHLEWSDVFRTDIPLVDEQHKGLFEIVNKIVDIFGEGEVEQDELEQALDELESYAGQHFIDEEREMVHHGVDARHQRLQSMEHHAFIYDLQRLRSYADDHDSLEEHYEHVLKFSASWLIYHTLRTDQKLAKQVKAIEAGKTPEEAYQYAETHPLSPAVYQKILEAVVHLWSDALERVADLEEEVNRLKDAAE